MRVCVCCWAYQCHVAGGLACCSSCLPQAVVGKRWDSCAGAALPLCPSRPQQRTAGTASPERSKGQIHGPRDGCPGFVRGSRVRSILLAEDIIHVPRMRLHVVCHTPPGHRNAYSSPNCQYAHTAGEATATPCISSSLSLQPGVWHHWHGVPCALGHIVVKPAQGAAGMGRLYRSYIHLRVGTSSNLESRLLSSLPSSRPRS